MKFRPKGWPLPKPKAIHHIIENFFTEWHAPKIHIQPLRRFLEHCMQIDLRAFYAGKLLFRMCSHDASNNKKKKLEYNLNNLTLAIKKQNKC